MNIEDFDYDLPKEFIAQHPVSPRDHSKLMVVKDNIEHKHFYDLINYLERDDVLVINETKVSHAKLVGKKDTGSPVDLIVEKTDGNKCLCQIATRNPTPGRELFFGKYVAKIISFENNFFTAEFNEDVDKIMADIGVLPTPPYVKEELEKDSHYQTCYSKTEGSVAAPTAGLHFTEEILNQLKDKGVILAKVCLHVGFGTFFPVRDINQTTLHNELFKITKETADIINNRKGRLIAVGTTSVRVLESSSDENGVIHPNSSSTDIFIKPGYKFKSNIDGLITNFHLPKSTLLMLVSAFIGRSKILNVYKEAINNNYRFFSFGDVMLLWKK